jgi:hypothetical protein
MPRRRLAGGAAACALSLWLSGVSWSTPPAADHLVRERTLAARVSRDRALALVRSLVALGPRMGGTTSNDRAAALLSETLRESGLVVEIVEDPPRHVHEEAAWTVALRGVPLASAWPHGFSPSLARTDLRLVTDDALPPGDGGAALRPLEGKAVIAKQGGRSLPSTAASLGAAALLIQPAEPGPAPEWAPLRERHTGGQPLPLPVFAVSHHDGEILRAAAADPNAVLTLALESSIREAHPRTVIATLPGAGDRRGEIILVCAHGDSDSGGPGADDNASGEAALVEVARALASAAAAGELPASRPEVRFAVWGAEIHSSRAYAAARAAELARHVAVFNYDQAGFGSERDALYYEGNDVPWNAPLLRTLEAAARDHAGQPGFWTAHTSNPVLGGTDMYAFLPPRHRGYAPIAEKVPVTTVFTAAWDHPTIVEQTPGWTSPGWPETGPLFIDYSAVYHSSGDRPELTTEKEPFNMERCARLVLLGILRFMEGRVEAPPETAAP